MAKIYISSTYSDLADCRAAAYRHLRSLRHDAVAMEDYVASDTRPADKCLADVASCDVYVGIFAWRYGYVPAKDNPEQRSITEMELRQAERLGKPRLIFLLDESAPWQVSRIEQGAGYERIRKLREELTTEYTVSFFKSCDELATQVAVAVTNALERPSHLTSAVASPPLPLDSKHISISRLPVTGSQLFGREVQLERLDEAWAGGQTHIISLVAWGGVGKSALVNYWLACMARESWRGAERVYAWSFYTQGTTDRAVSADQFIEAALTWFGDPDPNRGSPWDKGERLAQLVAHHRTLLVLDGLEPLQNPPGADEGKLKDQALQSLMRSLAAHNGGLCVISTRVTVADLAPFETTTAQRIDLDTLSPKAGAQVLTAQGVTGPQDELEKASEEFGGHSLALTLLGSYLADVYGGDITRRTEVADLEGDVRHGGHAQRVMASYEKWFGEGAEVLVLRILGLFNRPADKGSIDALRAAPAIPGLTDALQGLSESQWQQTLSKLRRAKLLAAPSSNQPNTLDTHPLVREHFGHQLKRDNPDAWREGNNRLYEHLTRTAKELPDTLEEMAPLYAAIAHGCEAGRYQEAYELFQRRVHRNNEYFSLSKLGAYGADLTALRGFFDFPWQPVSGLAERTKSLVLSIAGYDLQALGKLKESTQPVQAALRAAISQETWGDAAIDASRLGDTYLIIGDLHQALTYARQAVKFADQSRDVMIQIGTRASLADTLNQIGRSSESENSFREAEEMLKKRGTQFPVLLALGGFQYCTLLLDQEKYQDVQVRAAQMFKNPASWYALLYIAFIHLLWGRAYLLQAQREASDDFSKAVEYLNLAVDGLRQSGNLDQLPYGLLARAELYQVTYQFDRAQADLDEAMGIVMRGEMGLHEADCHLRYARLYLARSEKENEPKIKQENREKARVSWEKAKGMIERMGYHRRDRDVREVEEQLKKAGG